MVFEVSASGGSGNYTYTYTVYKDGVAFVGQRSTSNIFEYAPVESAKYRVSCKVTDGQDNCTVMSNYVSVVYGTLTFLYPQSAGLVFGTMPIAKWNAYDNAAYYLVSVRDLSTGNLVFEQEKVTDPAIDLSQYAFTDGHAYNMWVGAYNLQDARIAQAEVAMSKYTLPTIAYNTAVTDALDQPQDIAINWAASVNGVETATKYEFTIKEVSVDGVATGNYLHRAVTTYTPSYPVEAGKLKNNASYYVWVAALNAKGAKIAEGGYSFEIGLQEYNELPSIDDYTAFLQTDSRWAGSTFGYSRTTCDGKKHTAYIGLTKTWTCTNTIHDDCDPTVWYGSGCGLLSVTNAVYALTGKFADPTSMADWAIENGHRGIGATYHSLPKGFCDDFGDEYGIEFYGYEYSINETVKKHLLDGGTAVINVPGHFACIAAYDASTDKYLVLDSAPSSGRGDSGTDGRIWKTASQLAAGNWKVAKVHLIGKKK